MAYLNDISNTGGVSYFINNGKGIFYFPNATILVANDLITIQGNGIDNSFRFVDMPEEDRLGTNNAISLLIEWAKRGEFGASGINNAQLGDGTTATSYETAMVALIEGLSSKIDLMIELLKSIAR
jgi:hypothetical protein